MRASEALRAAADLLEPAGSWTRGVYSRDAEGKSVFLLSSQAVSFCVTGGVARVCAGTVTPHTPEHRRLSGLCYAALDQEVAERMGRKVKLDFWNDLYAQSRAEVVDLLRRGAGRAEEMGE